MSESKDRTTTTTPNGSSETTSQPLTSHSIPCLLTIFCGQEPPRHLTISPPYTIGITDTGKMIIKSGTFEVIGQNTSYITERTASGRTNVRLFSERKSQVKVLRVFGNSKSRRIPSLLK